jgi:hypothetical protein
MNLAENGSWLNNAARPCPLSNSPNHDWDVGSIVTPLLGRVCYTRGWLVPSMQVQSENLARGGHKAL